MTSAPEEHDFAWMVGGYVFESAGPRLSVFQVVESHMITDPDEWVEKHGELAAKYLREDSRE